MLGKECNRCRAVTDPDLLSPISVLFASCQDFFVIERAAKKRVNS